MKKVIITGSTGMVGKGVLLECLESDRIEQVLVINRSSLDKQHPKLVELLLKDFEQIEQVKEGLKGYDACFHCMGVTSAGKSEEQYHKLTFEITKSLVDTCYEVNPNMVFNYVSGAGTDSSEKGNTMWARVKGKTENYILNKGFADAYMFRAGAIIPEKGVKSKTGLYNALYVIMRPFFGLMKKSKSITTSVKLGQAMINSLSAKQELKLLENKDINELALMK
jgi:nucleoside-diphosphate-sugar epimerase